MYESILKRISSLLLVMVLAVLLLSACSGTAGAESRSTSSETAGLEAGNPPEEEKDEEIISEDEKHGRVANDMLGAAGAVVGKYEGFLGYGYNILTSAYFNHKDIKTSHPIIDMAAMVEKDLVYSESKQSRSVVGETFVSDSIQAYSKKLMMSASIDVDAGFTGSFKNNFKMEHSSQLYKNQKLVTTQAVLEAENEFILNVDETLLASYATASFKEAVRDKTAKEIIDTYGTHVLANISLGGRFDINYLYTKKESSTVTNIKDSAEAAYRYVSGTAEVNDEEKKKEIESSSNLVIKTYGGSLTVDPTSLGAAVKSYKEWSQGVENGNLSFVGASEIYPIWKVIAHLSDVDNAAAKSKAVKDEFDLHIAQIKEEFVDLISVPIYISEILIGHGKTKTSATNMLLSRGVTTDHILNIDLNKDAGGYWIYLGYKTTSDPDQAITDIVADYSGKSLEGNVTANNIAYTILPMDLNKGAGGKYICLYYTKDKRAGKAISYIQYQLDDAFEYNHVDGYEPVHALGEVDVLDLNKGAGGKYVYLWFKRS